jgi:RNA polymerase sigma factor (sigma-70 family)
MIANKTEIPSDDKLLQEYRSTKSSTAFGLLFSRYKHLVFGVCMKYLKHGEESEDAVMEIFEKLHLDINKQEISHFKSWLYMVSKNHCLMKLRKKGLKVEFPESLPPVSNEIEEDQEEVKIKEQLLSKVETSLTLLKPEQKKCIDLFYLQDKSYKDIVIETGLSLNEVKSHIQNGKANLKKMLSNIGMFFFGFFRMGWDF